VQRSIAKLRHVLGLQVAVDLETSVLWSELQSYYPDPETFIPVIVEVIQQWMDCLRTMLEEDDANAAWQESFLEYVNAGGKVLKVKVQVSG